MNPFAAEVEVKLRSANVAAELIDDSFRPDMFGNAVAIYRWGTLLLKFSRDRSLDALEIGSVSFPQRLFYFEDVEIAMGWRSLDDVILGRDKKSLEAIVHFLPSHVRELETAFSNDLNRFTKALAARAARSDPFADPSSIN